MRELQSLLERLQTRALLGSQFFDFDHDSALDERDADPFDSEWMRVNRELQDLSISAEQAELLKEIRKAGFLGTMAATKNSDLAGYVSDDFDLLGRGLIADSADLWLNALWVQYRANIFPRGELEAIPGTLRELLTPEA